MSADSYGASPMNRLTLSSALSRRRVVLPQLDILNTTASTNDVAKELAVGGAPEWTVVSAETQTRGRGRLGRSWASASGTSLLFSVILMPPSGWTRELGWVPLLAGQAVADAINEAGGDAVLKWPNDVVFVRGAEFRKVAGILAERTPESVVVGVGINVAMTRAELPVDTATSLSLSGVDVSREELLAGVLAQWQRRWQLFVEAGGDVERTGIRSDYESRCQSVGARISVDTGGRTLVGTGTGVDAEGHLLVDTGTAVVSVTSGDVTQLLGTSE